MHEDVDAIGVVGAGTMGTGIAQCLAEAGHRVVVVDPEAAALATGPARLRKGIMLSMLVHRAPAAASLSDTLDRIDWSRRLQDLDCVRFVLECAPERIPLKERIFRELDEVCPPHAVFASVTSAVPITRLAARTTRPERVLGMHFMNPAPLKETVEVIRSVHTGEDTVRTALDLLTSLGKKGIVVADAPGFVSNRVLMLTINEAATVVQEGTAPAGTVDRIFQDCFGHPMGPLGTADLIGLDTIVDTLRVLLECTGDQRFEPCDQLKQLVAAGRLGRKSGGGFHSYGVHAKADRAGPHRGP